MNTSTNKLQNKIAKLQAKIKNYDSYTKSALAKVVIELLSLEAQLEQSQNTTKQPMVKTLTFKKSFYKESQPDIYGKRYLVETDYQITTIKVTDNFVTSIMTLSNGHSWENEYKLYSEDEKKSSLFSSGIEYHGYIVDMDCKGIYNLKYYFKTTEDWRQWSLDILSPDNLKTFGTQIAE